MMTEFERALQAVKDAKADGRLTPQEIVWLVFAWLAAVACVGRDLTDPTLPVDQNALIDVLRDGWRQVKEVLDGVQLPASLQWLVVLISGAVEQGIPILVDRLADWLDAGDN